MDEARLIVIRGNSGAGKTSVALGLRQAYAPARIRPGVPDRDDTVLGAALLSQGRADRMIHWLAVRPNTRGRGVGRILLSAIMDRWPPPGDINVVTFGPDVIGGQPARALYESAGFQPAESQRAGPDGGSRLRFVLRQAALPGPDHDEPPR